MQKDSMGKLISVIYRYSQIYINNKLEKHGIGSGQYTFLVSLYECDGVSQEQLANELKIDKGTVARAINKLEVQGFVERKININDKRAYQIYITQKGYSIKEELDSILDSWNKIMMDDFSNKESNYLIELTEKIKDNLVKHKDCF